MVDRRAKYMSKSLERGSSAPLIKTGAANQLAKDVNPLEMASKMGHEFARKSYYKPTYCHHCSELLWGLINQGFQCSICNMNCHERCLPLLVVDCVHVLAEKIVDPIAHKWIGPKSSFKKKKWCNTCRLRIYGQAKYCQICRRYAHINCTAHSLNNCKNPSTYTSVANVLFEHHWIEGNLTSSAKCEVCGKSCSSDLSLTGFHCGWCGVTVHSSCYDFYTSRYKTCDFRDLIYMIVPPNSVSLPIKESSLVDDDVVDEMDVPQLFQPSDEGDSPTKGRQVIFIDSSGTCSTKLRKRTLHPFRVDHKMTCEDLLRVGLRKCNIPLDIEGLYLSTVDNSMKEREIYPHEIIYSLPQSYAGPLKVYIRKRDITREYKLKIFNSKLKSGVPHVNVIINDNTCVGDIINSAVMLFELEDDDPTGYCIYETNQAKGIYEKMLDVNEKPWASVRQLEIESLRDFTSLRYYLHPKEIMTTTLHLWKMDQSHLLSTDHVFAFITKATTTDGITVNLSDIEIGPILPKHGMCFININNPSLAVSVYSSIATSETCRVTALPNIHHEVFDHQQEPILVFINSKSGGRSGGDIINGFSRHLNPLQVFDLSNGGPMPGLYTFRNVPRYRVLACGGDGTVGWVLSSLDVLKDHLTIACPPCGVLPLGTGNDLARALKWGGGYNGEKIIPILFAIEEANCVPFDRWEVNFHNDANDKCVVMNNYLGIGLDAEIALDFHHAREENPEKFNSRFHNKTVYLQLGVQKTFIRDSLTDLTANISMTVDGKELNLPVGLKGVVLLNIQSWGAGSEPWGTSSQSEDGFVKNSYDDGILEIMGLSGPMHLGQIKGHIANGLRLAQGKIITISMRETLAVQIDGEAWLQPPSTLTITAIPYKAMMLVKSPHSFHGRGLSHREARSLVHKHSTGAMNSSGISYRRHLSTSPITDSVPPLGSDGSTASCNADGSERNPHMKKGKSTHTLYHRVE